MGLLGAVQVDLNTAQNPSAVNITVPPGTKLMYLSWTYWRDASEYGLASATINSIAPDQTFEVAGNQTRTATGVAEWRNPPTGENLPLVIQWDNSVGEGPTCIVSFWDQVATTGWRSRDGANAVVDVEVSFNIETQPGDIVVKHDQHFGTTTPSLTTGYSSAVIHANRNNESARLSFTVASGSTTTVTSEDPNYSSLVAWALIPDSSITIVPPSGALTLTGSTPQIERTAVQPTSAALVLTGVAPQVTQQFVRAPGSASLSFVGAEPIVQILGTVRPQAGNLILAGQLPIVLHTHTIRPGSGSLELVGMTPKVGSPRTIQPLSGTLTFTGELVEQILTVPSPEAGPLSLVGGAPVVSLGFNRQPVAGSLAIAGQVPVIRQNLRIAPSSGSLSLQGFAPSGAGNTVIRPSSGAITISSSPPQIAGSISIQVPSGELSAVGLAPALTGENTIRPAAGALSITGVTPVLRRGTLIQPPTGSLGLAGQVPDVRVPFYIQPPSGSLELAGQLSPGAGGSGDGTDGGTGIILRQPARQALRNPIRIPLRVFHG